jgi:crossover junction endodeoxyribonuclease RuvC
MGYGAVEERAGRLVHLGNGVLQADGKRPLEQRLMVLFHALQEIIREYRPQALAVEGVFTLRNARSALVLGHARGVALLLAAQAGIPVHEYPPARVKKAVGAGGSAGKDSVARMVLSLLKLERVVRADASDALAVALCHLNRHRAGAPIAASSAPGPARTDSTPGASWRTRLSPAYRPASTSGA